MKIFVTIARWVVGLLFIFSGLIKANDPLGLSYKMQEFFEAWHWQGLHNYTLLAAIVMNVLEVIAGVAIIIGWQKKVFTWLLLMLIVFFTFLTSYVLFSNKIHACGCFGDCVPLTPIQTFTKDIVLLLLTILLLLNLNVITPLFSKKISIVVLMAGFCAVIFLQWYVLKYLPLKDCLPYAQGKNIVEGMKLPANAVPDLYKMTFKYKKNGQVFEYLDSVPNNVAEDTTYEFVDRYDKLIQKGTGLPKIVDFKLETINGIDTTNEVLNMDRYVLLFAKDMNTVNTWKQYFETMQASIESRFGKIFIVTADAEKAANIFTKATILKCDATAIKTASRVNATYFIMHKGNIVHKISYANSHKIDILLGHGSF